MDDTLDPEKLQDNGEPQVTIQQQPVDAKPQASQEDGVTKHQSPLFVEEVGQAPPQILAITSPQVAASSPLRVPPGYPPVGHGRVPRQQAVRNRTAALPADAESD